MLNRIAKDGRLDFDGADGVGDLIRAEANPKDPQALIFRMVLDRALWQVSHAAFTSGTDAARCTSTPIAVTRSACIPDNCRARRCDSSSRRRT